jgi:hypothetical protein
MGINYIRLTRLIHHVDQFTLIDIFRIGSLLEIEQADILMLIMNQYNQDQAKKMV